MWGSPEITTGLYIWKSIIPSFLGNAVGALLVGIPYRYLFINDLSVFDTDISDREDDIEKRRVGKEDMEPVHEQLQLGGRTPMNNRSRPESTVGGVRTPSVKSGHEAEEK